MAVREIKTSISLDGEKAFRQAVNDASRAMRVMNAELKAIGAEFGVTGDKQQFLTQKSNNLRQAIAQQEQIVQALSGAVSDSAQKYGDAAQQTDGYRIKLANATAALNRMKQELAATDREAEELGRDSTRVGRQIEDGIGDGAKEAQESLSDAVRQMKDDISRIEGSVSFTVVSQVGQFVSAAIGDLLSFVDEYRDTRQKRAIALSGIQSEMALTEQEIDRYLLQIVGLTGDSDAAYETLQLLGQSKIDESFFETALKYVLGGYVKFGEEARPEAIAESLQESASSGELTGAIATMYTRLGEDVKAMNAAMENLPPEERVNSILTGLTGHGLAEAYEKFIKDEADLVAEQKAVENLSLKWAELAAEMSPIVTDIMNSLGMVVDDISDFVRKAKEKGFIAAVFDEAFGIDDTGNSDLFDKDGNLNPAVGEAWGLTPAEIDAYNAVHAEDNRKAEEEADWAAEARRIMEQAKQTREENIFPGVAFPTFSDDESIMVNAKKDGMTYGESYFSGFREALDGLIDDSKSSMLPTYDEMMEAYFMGGADALKGWIDSLALSEEDRAAADEIMRSIGVESGTGFDEGLKTSMNTAIENAKISGSNAAMGVGNGIAASSSYAVRQAWDMANGINAALASIGAGYNAPVIGRYGPSGNGDVYLDGKKVGETIAPTVNASLGKAAGRLTKVG
jgi:hypothetical protein|nr:MAG TPA: minor tail protein [Myoviridae sp. ct5MF11]